MRSGRLERDRHITPPPGLRNQPHQSVRSLCLPPPTTGKEDSARTTGMATRGLTSNGAQASDEFNDFLLTRCQQLVSLRHRRVLMLKRSRGSHARSACFSRKHSDGSSTALPHEAQHAPGVLVPLLRRQREGKRSDIDGARDAQQCAHVHPRVNCASSSPAQARRSETR